jgi:hypothetical protein
MTPLREVKFLHKDFLDHDNLHAFYKAREVGQYLIIVRDESDGGYTNQLKISYAD